MSMKAEKIFTTEAQLRTFIDKPMDLAVAKAIDHLDKYCIEFISRSPFVCIGSSADRGGDVSPRGDQPGFVQVLDANTLFIPERPGNNRIDTLTNIIDNPNVGLLFMIPGFEDCLRVKGKALIVQDETLLINATVNGKAPKLGIHIGVETAMLHCAKAVKRSKLWAPESIQDRKEMPTIGKMILEQSAQAGDKPDEALVAEVDSYVDDNYKNELY